MEQNDPIRTTDIFGNEIEYDQDFEIWVCRENGLQSPSLRILGNMLGGHHGSTTFKVPVEVYFKVSEHTYQGGVATSHDLQGVWVRRCDGSQVRYDFDEVYSMNDSNCELINLIGDNTNIIKTTAERRAQLIEYLEQFEVVEGK